MLIETFDDLHKAYPENRDNMSEETEREFVSHCYRLYKNEGFSKIFWTPYEDQCEHIGKSFVVVKELWDYKYMELECLPIWLIRFDTGEEIQAYAEEIIPSEMKKFGCNFTEDGEVNLN